jgi:hypothetical protein
MSLSRLFSVALVFSVAGAAAVVACGGDDGNKTNPDAKVVDSSNGSGSGSGSGSNSNEQALGKHCTPAASGLGQGDCPAGYTCLAIQGGHDTWCSKTCTQSADTCDSLLNGPGLGACLLSLTGSDGGSAMTYCGIVCAANAGSAVCPDCNGTCPSNGGLTCSASFGSGNNGGSACI